MACRKLKNLENPTFSDVDNFSHCRVMVLVHGPTWAIMGRDCWAMGRFSQVAHAGAWEGSPGRGRSRRAASRFSQDMACNGRVWGRNRRATGRLSQDMAYDSRGWGRSRRIIGRFSRGAASDGHVRGCGRRAMGQFSQIALPEVGRLLVSGTVLAGHGPRRQDLGKLGQSMHAFRGAS